MAYVTLKEAAPSDPGSAFNRLVSVMRRLRAPDGCPWDQEQTLESLRPFLLEEAHELLEAIESGDPEAHREELGDVLLQVVFQAVIQEEAGVFNVASVAEGIASKLIRRHPHVFADPGGAVSSDQSGGSAATWEAIKRKEKARRASILEGVPRSLPGLARAQALGARAARVGFDWPDAEGPMAKVEEEMAELEQARTMGQARAIEAELGDAFFALVNLARHLGVDAERAVHGANQRFTERFGWLEANLATQGRPLEDVSLEELEGLWEDAKSALARRASK